METELLIACKKLRLGSSLVSKVAEINADSHIEFLLKLFSAEIDERDRNRRNAYIKAARFELLKTFETYTFEDIKIPKTISVQDIKECVFIPKKENLILYGNVGAGKTHLAIAIGIAACNAGFRTRYWRTATLVNTLMEAKRRGELLHFMRQFEKLDLLICDEWGYVPIDSVGSKLLFQVVSECYERKSIIITTNLEYARWNDIFVDAKITAALLDRVIHHSHLIDFTCRDSRRLLDALMNKEKSLTDSIQC